MDDSQITKTLGVLIAALAALAAVSLAPVPAFADSASTTQVRPQESAAAAAFERFRNLAGEWRGSNDQGHAVRLRYEVVADGTTVLEHLDIDGEKGDHNMVTAYHLDGEALMLTHYCASGNQPRMRAASPGGDEVAFDLVDVTGAADGGHMHRAKFNFRGADELTSAWTWRENGEDAFTVVVEVERQAQ